MCHGREGRGSALFDVVLQDTVASADAESISDVILHSTGNGNSAMPAYGKTLTADQVSDIVSYLKKVGRH
jgi:mono/diheme cytochrome c family protein